MSKCRSAVCCVLSAAFVTFAAGSNAAPAKLYDLQVCVGGFANGSDPKECAPSQAQQLGMPTGPTPIEARVFNFSPPNTNSSINSIDLVVSVNWKVLNPPATNPPADPDLRVKVLDNSGKVGVDVSIRSHLRISNLAPIKPGAWVTVRYFVDETSCGDGSWNVTAYTGSTFSGDKFNPSSSPFVNPSTSVACAQLTCGQGLLVVQPQGPQSPTDLRYIANLMRGTNEDGATCGSLYVYQTPTAELIGQTPTVTKLFTVWDKTAADSEAAVFSYDVNLEPTTGFDTPPKKLSQMKMAWLPVSDTDLSPDFRPALACEPNAPFMPRQYTRVVADTGNKITVEVPSLTPPVVPFAIIIEQERLLVTKINDKNVPNTWTVTRTMGGTSPPASPHPTGAPVMSTPFRIVQSTDAGYSPRYFGQIAPICIQQIVAFGSDPLQFRATVIDSSFDPVRIGGF